MHTALHTVLQSDSMQGVGQLRVGEGHVTIGVRLLLGVPSMVQCPPSPLSLPHLCNSSENQLFIF